jgi:phosphoglycolate phosphatase
MKRLAIFDFDGTLFDTLDDVVICFNKALETNGFPTLTREEYLGIVGGNIDEMVSLLLKDNNTAENIELIKESYRKIYGKSQKENSRPFPQIRDVLFELQEKDILLAINSNRKNDSIKYFIGLHFPEIDFAAVEGHNPAYPSKPRPCGVKKIRRKLKIPKEETIYIGDSSTDIKTAKNGEIDCLLVSWGYAGREDFENGYPLEVIDNPSQILKYF